jgi:glutamyl-tRNA reductase
MLKRPYHILLVGTNFRIAPLDLREKLARSVNVTSLETDMESNNADESFALLSTCNRIEIYACTTDPTSTGKRLKSYLTRLEDDVEQYLYSFLDEEAIRQIIQVASGMDSMVLGEPQILLQVKHAKALTNNWSGKIIKELLHHSYTAGSRVRKVVEIKPGSSIGSAAADLILAKLNHKPNLLIMGGGKMAISTIQELRREKFGEIHVANRTPSKVRSAEFDSIRIHSLTDAQTILSKVDAAIIATSSPNYIVTAETMKGRENSKPIILVDISIPRNVDPNLARLPNLELYNIDNLAPYTKPTLNHAQIDHARQLIAEEARRFSSGLSALEVTPAIRLVRTKAEQIRRDETERALRKLSGVRERDAEVISALSSHIVNRLLHEPTSRVREHAKNGDGEEYGRVFKDLFGIDD